MRINNAHFNAALTKLQSIHKSLNPEFDHRLYFTFSELICSEGNSVLGIYCRRTTGIFHWAPITTALINDVNAISLWASSGALKHNQLNQHIRGLSSARTIMKAAVPQPFDPLGKFLSWEERNIRKGTRWRIYHDLFGTLGIYTYHCNLYFCIAQLLLLGR